MQLLRLVVPLLEIIHSKPSRLSRLASARSLERKIRAQLINIHANWIARTERDTEVKHARAAHEAHEIFRIVKTGALRNIVVVGEHERIEFSGERREVSLDRAEFFLARAWPHFSLAIGADDRRTISSTNRLWRRRQSKCLRKFCRRKRARQDRCLEAIDLELCIHQTIFDWSAQLIGRIRCFKRSEFGLGRLEALPFNFKFSNIWIQCAKACDRSA